MAVGGPGKKAKRARIVAQKFGYGVDVNSGRIKVGTQMIKGWEARSVGKSGAGLPKSDIWKGTKASATLHQQSARDAKARAIRDTLKGKTRPGFNAYGPGGDAGVARAKQHMQTMADKWRRDHLGRFAPK